MKKGGFSVVQDDQDIDIEFRYYGNMDISVPDIKGIVEELDNSGKEVICVIQDYIERLRPPMMSAEKRNALADISNQMHDLAIELDIPIITASQFNREGVAIIEEQREKGNTDIGRKVGTGNISESFGMLKNFDVNIAIVVEYDSSEERYYLSFRRLKFRGDTTTSIDYFLQPFAGKNTQIQLMDDISTGPLYRLSLMDEIGAQIKDDSESIATITQRNVGFLAPMSDDPDENMAQEFIGVMFDDIDRSGVPQEVYQRDEDGFIMLIPRNHGTKELNLEALGNVHMMSI